MVSLIDVAALRGMDPGGEEVQAERPGEEGAGPLTSDADAGAVQARGERPEGTLAGCDGHDPARHPRLRRNPDLEEPFPGALVHPAGGENGQGVPAHFRGDDLLPSARIDAAISERDRKSTRLNSSHVAVSYDVFCLKEKKKQRPLHFL